MLCPGCSNTRATNDSIASDPFSSQSQPKDSQPHILVCGGYSDLQEPHFDPSDDKMLAKFFIRVVERRIENGEE